MFYLPKLNITAERPGPNEMGWKEVSLFVNICSHIGWVEKKSIGGIKYSSEY